MRACLVAVGSGGYSNVQVSAKRTLEADRLCDEAQQARGKNNLLAIHVSSYYHTLLYYTLLYIYNTTVSILILDAQQAEHDHELAGVQVI